MTTKHITLKGGVRVAAALALVSSLAGTAYASSLDSSGALNISNGGFTGTGSRIFDNANLHVATDDYLFLDAPILTSVSNSLSVGGELQIRNGGFAGTGSKLYDNGNLHVKTDDWLYLDAPVEVYIQNAMQVGGDLTVLGTTHSNLVGNVTGNLTGNVTGNLTGNVTGNLTGNATTATNAGHATTATTAVGFSGTLVGDVTGTQGATVVSNVSDSALSGNVARLNATNVFTQGITMNSATRHATLLLNNDGNLNVTGNTTLGSSHWDTLTVNAGSNFVNGLSGHLTGNVTGNADTATNATNATTAVDFSGTLVGDVTGTQGATVVSHVNASNIDSGALNDLRLSTNVALLNAVSNVFTGNLNVSGTINAGGGLNGNVTGNLTGTADNAINATYAIDAGDADTAGYATAAGTAGSFSGTLVGDVTGTQGATVVSHANAGNIDSGTLNDLRLSTNVALLNAVSNTLTGNLTVNGTITGNLIGNVTGNATNATNATTAVDFSGTLVGDVTGTQGATVVSHVNASNIDSGSLSDSRLSTNVTLEGNSFNGIGQLVKTTAVDGYLPSLDGRNLTNLNGGDIQNGTITSNKLAFSLPGDLALLTAANQTFTGNNTFSGSLIGNLTGNADTATNATNATNATTAVDFSGTLVGDVTGTQGATVVSNVNDSALSANVALLNAVSNTFTGTITAAGFNGPLTGNVTGDVTGNLTGNVNGGSVTVGGVLSLAKQTLTIANNFIATPATALLTPTKSYVKVNCQDTDGCGITMDVSGATEGDVVVILNDGPGNPITIADSAGVSELAGTFTGGSASTLTLMYDGSAWVELSRSIN